MLRERLETAVAEVRALLASPELDAVNGDDARGLAALFADVERLGAAGVALMTPKVMKSGSFAKGGFGSGSDWLGSIVGTSPTAARRILKNALSAAESPALSEALKLGEISSSQLEVLAPVTASIPEAGAKLLSLVGQVSQRELSDEACRLRAEARDIECERARRARVNRFRHIAWHQDPNGGIRGGFLADEVEWARIAPVIEKRAAQLQREAHRAGSDEALSAYRFDAWMEIMSGGGGGGGGSGTARPHTLVIVNAESLRRGTTAPGELCEIEGIGPVSVEAATELLGEGNVQFIIRDGVDICTVTSSTRAVPQRVAMALIVRDRVCVKSGCGERDGLEQDHCDRDYSKGGPTELANLVRLCPMHHTLKTHGKWRIKGKPGAWMWIAPKRPKSAGYIERARKLAAIKGKATRAGP